MPLSSAVATHAPLRPLLLRFFECFSPNFVVFALPRSLSPSIMCAPLALEPGFALALALALNLHSLFVSLHVTALSHLVAAFKFHSRIGRPVLFDRQPCVCSCAQNSFLRDATRLSHADVFAFALCTQDLPKLRADPCAAMTAAPKTEFLRRHRHQTHAKTRPNAQLINARCSAISIDTKVVPPCISPPEEVSEISAFVRQHTFWLLWNFSMPYFLFEIAQQEDKNG
eukprot:6182974-Pleurochrysis_carterae.AAC.2